MIRKIFLWVLLCLISIGTYSVAAAEADFGFGTSDVNVQKGRLFEVTLSVKSQEKIAAFVGEISFESDAVEYREAKTTDENAVVSVNSNEQGKITFAYLCDDGISCADKTEIIAFKFKANAQGTYELSMNVRDVVNVDCGDVSVSVCESAQVSINASNNSHTSSPQAQTETALEEKSTARNFTKVDGNSVNIYIIGSAVAAVVVLLVIVSYVSYKSGIRKQKKSSDKDSKESENDEEKT